MPPSKEKPRKRVYKKPLNEKHIIGFLFSICLLITLFLGCLLLTLSLLKIPDIKDISRYQPLQASEIIDRHGNVVRRLFVENRTVVSLAEMAPYLPKAFVASEDGNFYEHPGLDFWSVFRAAVNNMRSGRRGQGGSTITQQVARSLLLTPEKTYIRKLKEAILAWRIDTLLSKDEILFIYLNQIYLGSGTYGVEAAAQTYFGKRAKELSLGECALLAGLPQSPSRYSPHTHMEAARKRQRYVLNRMAIDGYIQTEEARDAYTRSVVLRSRSERSVAENGYFIQLVSKQARKILGVSLNRAGLRIYTTLDSRQQKKAVAALRDGVEHSFPGESKVQGAAVMLDACSGQVRTLVGGLDFTKSAFDRATQGRRSAGSVFKPLLYATAFENGFTPQSSIDDAPFSIRGSEGKKWQPRNFSGKHYGATSLRDGFVYSRNIVAIKLLQRLGVKKVQKYARDVGIQKPITADLSLALGATGVSLLDISAAYSPFVCQGTYHPPLLITAIEDSNGKSLYKAAGKGKQVLQGSTASQVKEILSAVITEGTGKRAAGLLQVSGGKTGTTNENRDAWFVGFAGRNIGGVWVGHDDNSSLGSGKNGGMVAAPIWRKLMERDEL